MQLAIAKNKKEEMADRACSVFQFSMPHCFEEKKGNKLIS